MESILDQWTPLVLKALTLAPVKNPQSGEPPSPHGSLDAALASAGMPVFALDLRRLPKEGPVADWFHQPHQARTVGAI